MSIRAIALDLDGTLLEPGARIHPDTKSVLGRFVDRGGLVLIDTGRPYEAILRIFSENEVLPECPYPHACIAEEREIYLRGEGGHFLPHQPWNDRIIKAEHEMLSVARTYMAAVEEALAKDGIVPKPPNTELEDARGFVERFFSSREEAIRARDVAVAALPGDLPIQVVRNNRLIALRHRDVGKGKALTQLASLLGLKPADIMAVGDSHNDLEMLDGQMGFRSATVANADEEVKVAVRKAGGAIADRPHSLGVADLVSHLVSRGVEVG